MTIPKQIHSKIFKEDSLDMLIRLAIASVNK